MWSTSNPYYLAAFSITQGGQYSNEKESRWYLEDSRRLVALKQAAMRTGLFNPANEIAWFEIDDVFDLNERVQGFINHMRMRACGMIPKPMP